MSMYWSEPRSRTVVTPASRVRITPSQTSPLSLLARFFAWPCYHPARPRPVYTLLAKTRPGRTHCPPARLHMPAHIPASTSDSLASSSSAYHLVTLPHLTSSLCIV